MSYDILLIRPDPGKTVDETLQRRNAEFDINDESSWFPDLHLSADDAADWERICTRTRDEVSDIEREEFPSYVGRWTVDPRMQLRYMEDSADLSIYYWYGAAEAPRALEAAYNLVALIEAETDLISIDGQTGERCTSPNLPMAVGIYTGTRSTVLRAIAEREDGPSPTAM